MPERTVPRPAAISWRPACLVLLGILLPSSALAQDPVTDAPPGVRLSGVVRDAATGRPVPSAWIVLPILGRRAQTGPDGRFVVDGVSAGRTLVLHVEQLGYDPAEVVVVPEADAAPVRVELRPRPLELEGMEVSAARAYQVDERLARRVDRYRYGATIHGQLELLSADAGQMVEWLWEEARTLVVPCSSAETLSWEEGCMQWRGKRMDLEVCIDDAEAPGGPSMLYMFAPADLYRVEVLPDLAQIRVYTRPYVQQLRTTGKVPPIWPRWLGGCMGGDVAWSPPTKGREEGG